MKTKRIYPDDPADYTCVLVRPACRHRNCKAPALINGLCCPHYLKALDKFEKQSRKAKLVAKVQRTLDGIDFNKMFARIDERIAKRDRKRPGLRSV